jgi:glycosyltransferase involved in cell wall biosynthesis
MNKPLVSIIVPTLNEEKFISLCLNSLNNQTVSRNKYEIIVSDSSSHDNTVKVAKRLADKVIVCKRQSAGFGRNFGVKQAKGKYLGFVDAVSNNWVEGLIESLEKGVAATGPIEELEKESLKIKLFFDLWDLQTRASIIFGKPLIPGANFAITRKLFDKLGGFPDGNIICEDIMLSRELPKHGKVIFSEKMIVKTSSRRKDLTLSKHVLSRVKFFVTNKAMSWDDYRKDYSKKK